MTVDIQNVLSSAISSSNCTIEKLPFVREALGQSQLKPPRKPPFGNAETAKVYRAAKDLAIKHNIFRLCRVHEDVDANQLTICNLWRIKRLADSSISTLEFDLAEERWKEVSEIQGWPEIPFYPIAKTNSLTWWRQVVSLALDKVLDAAGYKDLPESLGRGESPDFKCLPPYKMRGKLKEFYLGRYTESKDRKGKWSHIDGLLKSPSMEAGARALRAAFFDHVYDSTLMSAVLVIDFRQVSFTEYLKYARYRAGFLKVAREHRNLLPILPHINPAYWEMDDLFSRKLWVRDGRSSTKLDRRPISIGRNRVRSFDNVRAWRWMLKASPMILANWLNGGQKSQAMMTNIALASVNIKAPVLAYMKLVRWAYIFDAYGISEAIQRFIRAYLLESARVWKEEGFAVVRPWINQNDGYLVSILDYLDAEGFDHGYPTKRCTWSQLLRRSNEWHLRLALEELDDQLERGGDYEWSSKLPETVIGDIVFTPITNARTLIIEGFELKHCVGSSGYIYRCANGGYMVFSVSEPGGARSTLGLAIAQGEVLLDQHRGIRNSAISKKADQAGRKLASLYREALKKG
ncbi:PcfJ domain-containing protein [Pseudomonas luteola]|uniref:PcfJ domain-containing protein n=1 Tax=Pseudomonas luteola TaxID=47886 RepID=UPI00289ABC5D|nr:PcfJ domain-containing protein [Pseudomonas luteola]